MSNPTFPNDIAFREAVQRIAIKSLRGAMNEDEARRIAGQTALGFFTAMRTAKDPTAYLQCTEASVASAVAASVGTRLVAGGPNAPAYLVPQRARRGELPQLQFRVNHRGWAVLGLRGGFLIDPVPVSMVDDLSIDGPDISLKRDPDTVPEGWDDLRGVVVYITHIDSGTRLTAWVPKVIIQRRRGEAAFDGVWRKWPVEMSMGAAIRYCVARGKLPIDTVEVQFALTSESSVIEGTATVAQPRVDGATAISSHQALGLPAPPPVEDNLQPPEEPEAIPAGNPDDAVALEGEYKARIGDGWQALLERAGGSLTQPIGRQPEDVRTRYAGLLQAELAAVPAD